MGLTWDEYFTAQRAHAPGSYAVLQYGCDVRTREIYIVSRLCPGADLHRAVPGMDQAQNRQTLADILGAVCALHAQGVCHNDLRANNVRVAPDGSVQLIDFGNATGFCHAFALGDLRLPAREMRRILCAPKHPVLAAEIVAFVRWLDALEQAPDLSAIQNAGHFPGADWNRLRDAPVRPFASLRVCAGSVGFERPGPQRALAINHPNRQRGLARFPW